MRARGFVKKTDKRTLQVVGNFIGTLLIRSFERTERIYKAMLSKGYQGEFHSLTNFHSAATDWYKAGLTLVVAVSLFSMDAAGLFRVAATGWY